MKLEIQIFRHGAWQERAAGDIPPVSEDRIRAEVARYVASSFYPHRAIVDGAVVCEMPGGVKPHGQG